jgi:hypothetical protein
MDINEAKANAGEAVDEAINDTLGSGVMKVEVVKAEVTDSK